MSPMASAGSSGGSGLSTLLLLLPLLLIAYLLFSQRRRAKKMQEMQSQLQIGSRVMTTTGLYGTVSHLDEATVYIEAAPGVVLQWDKRAVVPAPAAMSATGPVVDEQAAATEGDSALREGLDVSGTDISGDQYPDDTVGKQ